jgi:hypothetical protein
VPQSVVGVPLRGVVEGLVGLLEGVELGGGVGVVVEVRMVLSDLGPERLFHLGLGGVLVYLQKFVEVDIVVSHADESTSISSRVPGHISSIGRGGGYWKSVSVD